MSLRSLRNTSPRNEFRGELLLPRSGMEQSGMTVIIFARLLIRHFLEALPSQGSIRHWGYRQPAA